MEILTVSVVAALLGISKRNVYELVQERTRSGDVGQHPLPFMKKRPLREVSQE
jgi:hypothetical protein